MLLTLNGVQKVVNLLWPHVRAPKYSYNNSNHGALLKGNQGDSWWLYLVESAEISAATHPDISQCQHNMSSSTSFAFVNDVCVWLLFRAAICCGVCINKWSSFGRVAACWQFAFAQYCVIKNNSTIHWPSHRYKQTFSQCHVFTRDVYSVFLQGKVQGNEHVTLL